MKTKTESLEVKLVVVFEESERIQIGVKFDAAPCRQEVQFQMAEWVELERVAAPLGWCVVGVELEHKEVLQRMWREYVANEVAFVPMVPMAAGSFVRVWVAPESKRDAVGAVV